MCWWPRSSSRQWDVRWLLKGPNWPLFGHSLCPSSVSIAHLTVLILTELMWRWWWTCLKSYAAHHSFIRVNTCWAQQPLLHLLSTQKRSHKPLHLILLNLFVTSFHDYRLYSFHGSICTLLGQLLATPRTPAPCSPHSLVTRKPRPTFVPALVCPLFAPSFPTYRSSHLDTLEPQASSRACSAHGG